MNTSAPRNLGGQHRLSSVGSGDRLLTSSLVKSPAWATLPTFLAIQSLGGAWLQGHHNQQTQAPDLASLTLVTKGKKQTPSED